MEHMKNLVGERAQCKAALTRFSKFYETVTDTTAIDLIESRLEKAVELLGKFEDVQSRIELLSESNDEEAAKNEEERERFENIYHSLITKVKRHIKRAHAEANDANVSHPTATPVSSPSIPEASLGLKLPTLGLPMFNGERDQWVRFRESFESMIHQNETLTNIQKFHYLYSSISGAAMRAIRSLGISDSNYLAAWQKLKKRFEDSNALIEHHVKALFDLPHIAKGSHVALRQLIDDATNHVTALKALGESTDFWGALLLRLIVMKLDNGSRNEWKKHAKTLPKRRNFENLINFLEGHCQLLEDSEYESRPQQSKPGHMNNNANQKRSNNPASFIVNLDTSCPLCKANHRLSDCAEFAKLAVSARRSKVGKLRLCFNCLQPGHMNRECKSSNCRKCGKNHHTLVHIDTNNAPATEGPSTSSNVARPSSVGYSQALLSHTGNNAEQVVFLSTAVVLVEDSRGQKYECRAMLDQGSQANFVSETFAKKLNLPMQAVNTAISGIGHTSHAIRGKVELMLSSRNTPFKRAIKCLVIPKISGNIPNFHVDRASLPIPEKLTLADPHFCTPREVDLLIGNSLFWDMICIGQHRMGSGYPMLQKTQLGWIIAGDFSANNIVAKSPIMCHLSANNDLDSNLEKFWAIEEVLTPSSDLPPLDPSDPCEIHFAATTVRDDDGAYVVSIPFTDQLGNLGESRRMAEKRLYALERKFERVPGLKAEYVKFLSEYLELGHMSEVPSGRIREGESAFYLPHHAVFKVSSTTTKLRVVFDGSATTTTGVSLNQVQRVGPIVQDDLFSIVLRLRKNRFVISADVAKMYRQVRVNPRHRRFQRILWRRDPSEAIKVYELNTVTYGTASASYLATRVLRKLGDDIIKTSPMAGRAIIRDFYVDDLLSGADTLEEARTLKADITRTLAAAGMELRKWAANDPRILNHSGSQENVALDADKDPKTLGLLWSPSEDCLRYSVPLPSQRKITKRSILSEIAQIFDPLGLVGPAIIQAKVLMQTLWELKTNWDESLPLEIHNRWETFRNELTSLNDLRISRAAVKSHSRSVQLHGFCDASEKAYGACVYIRSQNHQGQVTCHLLCAKSKVAPLKTISLPRLELCGALLLSRLVSKVRAAFAMDFESEHYWTDSTIVLAWIKAPPAKWRTFVANRVTKIQQSTKGEWRHVSSQDNPADIISRGINPSLLATCSIWWHGPTWIYLRPTDWPSQQPTDIEDLPERKTSAVAMIALASFDVDIFERFSRAKKLFRVVAYCVRFYNKVRARVHNRNIKDKGDPISVAVDNSATELTIEEIAYAERTLVSLVQRCHFSSEISCLSKGQPVPKKSQIGSLSPFLDKLGLLRVGGRLRNAPISYEQQHPVILPAKHRLTKLLIEQEHLRLLHAGCNAVMASLRAKYWPLSCKNAVKGVLRSCVRCFRVKPTTLEYLMGELPADRVTPSRPFSVCGVDYAGPFLIKEHSRARTSIKTYLCIFVCFSTKAVHIELATDMSTDSFLNCLRRFIARRGRCSRIYSDNGSNFVGAKNELNDLGVLIADKKHNSKVHSTLLDEHIEWHLIPPGSPNFGGLWESAVKSAKYHIKRVIGETRLTYEELYTVLTQVESCLNSRPLCALSEDPTDYSALTPGHFLVGEALASLPHPDLREVKLNRLNRFQLLQQMVQHFWSRWQSEYLHQLQQRNKWQHSAPTKFGPGTLVTIKEDNTPPLRWRLGRIVELHPGKDNVTRVVSIQTSHGLTKRPVSKICILPCGDDTRD